MTRIRIGLALKYGKPRSDIKKRRVGNGNKKLFRRNQITTRGGTLIHDSIKCWNGLFKLEMGMFWVGRLLTRL